MVAVAAPSRITVREFSRLSFDEQDAYLRDPDLRIQLPAKIWRDWHLDHQPTCQNPNCDCFAIPDRRAKSLKWRAYCSYDCRKPAWFYRELSATSRKTKADKLDAIENKMDKLVQLVMDLNVPVRTSPPASGGSQRGVKDIDTDDLITVSASKSSKDNNSGWNMIIAATIQNLGHINALSAEIQAYAIRTKRANQSHLSPENYQRAIAKTDDTAAVGTPYMASDVGQPASSGPKPIAIPKSFTPSSEEDDDDDLLL